MTAEQLFFITLRDRLIQSDTEIKPGKMMSSAAITWKGKVFTFLSTKGKMVFKLGKSFDSSLFPFPIKAFNPFTKRGPLNGWYEIEFENRDHWEKFAEFALSNLKKSLI